MLNGKNYRALDKLVPVLPVTSGLSTEYEQKAPLKRLQTAYSEIAADVTENTRQEGRGTKTVESLKTRVEKFKKC